MKKFIFEYGKRELSDVIVRDNSIEDFMLIVVDKGNNFEGLNSVSVYECNKESRDIGVGIYCEVYVKEEINNIDEIVGEFVRYNEMDNMVNNWLEGEYEVIMIWC